jgi:hypothetical protein
MFLFNIRSHLGRLHAACALTTIKCENLISNQWFACKGEISLVLSVTDLDGNGVWDADEVKALFLKELDKMYTPGAAEDDMRERIEELECMR